MKVRTLISALLLSVMLPLSMSGQAQGRDAIVVKSCDGDVRISEMCIELRDYVLIVDRIEDGSVHFRDYDAGVEATLDLRCKDRFCLTVVENGLSMRIKCCWKNVRIPEHADIWNRLTDHDRAFFSRTAMHRSLLAARHDGM